MFVLRSCVISFALLALASFSFTALCRRKQALPSKTSNNISSINSPRSNKTHAVPK